MNTTVSDRLILVTGATGYVGGRLVPRLLEEGYRVRVFVRDPNRLKGRPWQRQVEIVAGDALKPETLPPAMAGVWAAYYLIHSMGSSGDFHARDLTAARHFGAAVRAADVDRIIYLSGLGSEEDRLSHHLRSRHLTGDALRESGVSVTEFRAAIIVGSGSISFEMVRNLTERFPVLIVPRWMSTRIQPIGIRDTLSYLTAALEKPECRDKIVEIGGADVLTYADMVLRYAAERRLHRILIPVVPVLPPRLPAYWVHWLTPIPARIAFPLIEGLRNEVVVRDDTARRLFPEIEPMDYATAVRRALERLREGDIESIWSDALASSQGDRIPPTLRLEQGVSLERREINVSAPSERVFKVIAGLGGRRGWVVYNWIWQLRGMMDRMVGGVGLRRGRRDPDEVRVGDAVDFWRVEAMEPGQMLRLRAEMKLPGRGWLQFQVEPLSNREARLIQTAYFAPKGLFGLLYWYSLYPLHGLIFSKMVQGIARQAEGSDV